jgi:hypothetical protein
MARAENQADLVLLTFIREHLPTSDQSLARPQISDIIGAGGFHRCPKVLQALQPI